MIEEKPKVIGLSLSLCKAHGEKIREELCKHGMEAYVAKSGEELAEKVKEKKFDAFLMAHNIILLQAVRMHGKELATPPAEGEKARCPLCFLKLDNWIDNAVHDVREVVDKMIIAGNGKAKEND